MKALLLSLSGLRCKALHHIALGNPRVKFCRQCSAPLEMRIPVGEREWRPVCTACSTVDYANPKLVVGCIVEHEGRLLLCRRAIQPCRGLWTLPAGYLELGEGSAAGAARETWEEAGARVEVLAPYSHFDIPIIGQAYLLFRARLMPPYTHAAGEESLETAMFLPDDIPFDQIAFTSIGVALRHFVADMRSGQYHIHHGVIAKVPGTQPNDPAGFQLVDHFAIATSVGTGVSAQPVPRL
ncbi:hypothetical protein WJX81_005356 [Elliptochloris bilobata]|uniref:Nudix hydrolase domain-containing protein n=1 Tax=Elliptochloris bilobata TaxID=381761 RepID=A0AAW1S1E8_9CHLO